MSSKDKYAVKWELRMTAAEAGAWLAGLAETLGAGGVTLDGVVVPVAGVEKIKVSVTPMGVAMNADEDGSARQEVLIRVKIRTPKADRARPADRPGSADRPRPASGSYGSLKKRMGRDFKALRQAATAGGVPDSGLLGRFLVDARAMAAFPGKGEEFYPAFLREVDSLEQTHGAGDPEAMTQSLARLDQLKKDCHRRFK